MFTAAGFSLRLLASQPAITTMEPINMALDITQDGSMLCTMRMIKCMQSRGTYNLRSQDKQVLTARVKLPKRGGDV